MAKTKIKREGKLTTITTPSRYGSHRSMVISEMEKGMVRCRDDDGDYITEVGRLDNGLADSNRAANRIKPC